MTKWYYFFSIIFLSSFCFGEQCQITSPLPVPVLLTGCTYSGALPNNSTSYIQNTLSPTTTTQAYSVQQATVTDQLTLPFLTPGQCTTTDSYGRIANIACGSGSGDMFLASTQTITGAKIFTSSVVINGGMYISTLSVTGNYTAVATNTVIMANCGSACTVTLPTAVNMSGKLYRIKSLGTGVMTIGTTSSQTIDGSLTIVPNPNQYAEIDVISDGSNWEIL